MVNRTIKKAKEIPAIICGIFSNVFSAVYSTVYFSVLSVVSICVVTSVPSVSAIDSSDIFRDFSLREFFSYLWQFLSDLSKFVFDSLQSQNIRYLIVLVLLWIILYSIVASAMRRIHLFGGENMHFYGKLLVFALASLMTLGVNMLSKNYGFSLIENSAWIIALILMFYLLRWILHHIFNIGQAPNVGQAWRNLSFSSRDLGNEVGAAGRRTGSAAANAANSIWNAGKGAKTFVGQKIDDIKETKTARDMLANEENFERADRIRVQTPLRQAILKNRGLIQRAAASQTLAEADGISRDFVANISEMRRLIDEEKKNQQKLLQVSRSELGAKKQLAADRRKEIQTLESELQRIKQSESASSKAGEGEIVQKEKRTEDEIKDLILEHEKETTDLGAEQNLINSKMNLLAASANALNSMNSFIEGQASLIRQGPARLKANITGLYQLAVSMARAYGTFNENKNRFETMEKQQEQLQADEERLEAEEERKAEEIASDVKGEAREAEYAQ